VNETGKNLSGLSVRIRSARVLLISVWAGRPVRALIPPGSASGPIIDGIRRRRRRCCRRAFKDRPVIDTAACLQTLRSRIDDARMQLSVRYDL